MAQWRYGTQSGARLSPGLKTSISGVMAIQTLTRSKLFSTSTSYSLFRSAVLSLGDNELATPVCFLLAAYSRLKNLVKDQLSLSEFDLIIEKKAKEGWIGRPYEPERQHRILPADFENEERFNSWIEETFCHLILRRRQEKKEKDKDLLYLFRLLSLKYRAEHPSKCTKYPLKADLVLALESKICSCVTVCFDSILPKPKGKPKITNGKLAQRGYRQN